MAQKAKIYKLYQMGVQDRLVLIRDYLTNYRFQFTANGNLSTTHPLEVGVPQGTVRPARNTMCGTGAICGRHCIRPISQRAYKRLLLFRVNGSGSDE